MLRRPRRRSASPRVLFLQSSRRFAADAQVHAGLMRTLPALGVEVHVAFDPGDDANPSTAAPVYRSIPGIERLESRFGPRNISRRPRDLLRVAFVELPATAVQIGRLAAYARRQDITAVHATEKAREALFAWAVARLSGGAVVIHLHVKVEGWFSAPTRWVMRRADVLLAISDFVAESAVAMGFDRSSVRVARNALAPHDDGGSFDGDRDAARAAVLEEFGLDTDVSTVSILARLNPWKGHAQLFRVVASLPDQLRDLVVIVAGVDDGSEEELRTLVETLGIGNIVRFVGFRQDAQRIMLASDVFAMPSFEEPFGLVYLEAMAAGTPVLALRTGGTPEAVIDGVTGLLSEPGDDEALGRNLARLLTDRDLADRLGSAGRSRVAASFTPPRLAADVAAIYRELLHGG
jgi:glycosyltransferase involved in cell wall biosynthesis